MAVGAKIALTKRAQVGNAQTNFESEMALFWNAIGSVLENMLDTADIVVEIDMF
jgi:hypothetical protein